MYVFFWILFLSQRPIVLFLHQYHNDLITTDFNAFLFDKVNSLISSFFQNMFGFLLMHLLFEISCRIKLSSTPFYVLYVLNNHILGMPLITLTSLLFGGFACPEYCFLNPNEWKFSLASLVSSALIIMLTFLASENNVGVYSLLYDLYVSGLRFLYTFTYLGYYLKCWAIDLIEFNYIPIAVKYILSKI